MAMTMTGEATLPANRPKVWALLNDPQVLKACIPGCESLERVGDNGFAAVVKTKIGPVSATFRGKVELTDIVPLVGYTISGEGEGGVAGFAKGGAKVSLADAEGGTLLRYDVEAHVGGKIAQLGARLVDGVAKNMADKFFANFAAAGSAQAPAGAAEPLAPSIAAAAPPVESPAVAHSRPSAAPPAIPTKKSWSRRIWAWFVSLWR
jgi:carbon monoxide dehydrogenase subunit G